MSSFVPVFGSPDNPRRLWKGRYCYAPLEWQCLGEDLYADEYDEGQDEGDKPVTLVLQIRAILRVPEKPVEPHTRGGKGKASPLIQDPLRSLKRNGTRMQKLLGTFWITPPIKRSEGELRHGCICEEGGLFLPEDL